MIFDVQTFLEDFFEFGFLPLLFWFAGLHEASMGAVSG
jgi:hypothetical protein